jgi:hypothetical protein
MLVHILLDIFDISSTVTTPDNISRKTTITLFRQFYGKLFNQHLPNSFSEPYLEGIGKSPAQAAVCCITTTGDQMSYQSDI